MFLIFMAQHKYYLVPQNIEERMHFAVIDSLLGVERHSGTVTGLPLEDRLQKLIH